MQNFRPRNPSQNPGPASASSFSSASLLSFVSSSQGATLLRVIPSIISYLTQMFNTIVGQSKQQRAGRLKMQLQDTENVTIHIRHRKFYPLRFGRVGSRNSVGLTNGINLRRRSPLLSLMIMTKFIMTLSRFGL
jgi:hypothetical protein